MNDKFTNGLIVGGMVSMLIVIVVFMTQVITPMENGIQSGKEFKLGHYKYLCNKTKEIKTVEVKLGE